MKKSIRKILLIGPIPEPITGVSIANKVVIENIGKSGNFQIEYINTSYQKFEENHGKFSFEKILFFVTVNFQAYKILRNDIIYITPGQTFLGILKYLIFILTSKLFMKELVLHIHGNYLREQYENLSGIKKKIFSSIVMLSDKGIVLSKSLSRNMEPFLKKDKIFIVNNFVEDYLLEHENLINKKYETNKLRIIYISNLMKEKGIFDLLEAFLIMKERGIVFEAKIAGNIDESIKKSIKIYFDKLDNVKYCGIVKEKAKYDIYAWGNIFILPTYYVMEGQPISILEAMATGNVILTTKHAGIPDIFKNKKNGYYIQKNSAMNIVDRLQNLSHDMKKRKGISVNNLNNVKEKFTVDHFINNITNIFNAR